MVSEALSRMSNFHEDIESLYKRNGLEFFEDLGRRNILMSRPQEKFFADVIKKKFNSTHADGKTGQPDIIIPELSKEIECKITSKGSGWNLQTDYETLKNKGSLDYLYLLCDKEFKKFSVLYFKDLDCSDFRVPSPGSRGKSSMIFWKGMKKCSVLWGDVENLNRKYLKDIQAKMKDSSISKSEKQKLKNRKKYWNNTPTRFRFILKGV